MKKRKISVNSVQAFLMILLPLIGFLVFKLYPILWTFRWAFFSYNGIPSQTRFVGLDNFIRMFTVDKTYWGAWLNTLKFTCMKVPVELPLALILAIFLSRKNLKGSALIRGTLYLPNIISPIVVGLIISCMFSYNGFINHYLMKAGLITENIDWFSSQFLALTVLTIGSIWSSFGVNVMYFLAALCNVSDDVYEAAEIDGAGVFTKFFRITLPLIMPVFSTILLMSLVGTLSTNEYIFAVTGGGPGGSTYTVLSYLTMSFVPGFTDNATPALGYGCAISLMTTLLFGLIAVWYKWFDKKMSNLY